MIIEQLKLLKSKTNLSNQQISERSGVPLQTVNRIGANRKPFLRNGPGNVKSYGWFIGRIQTGFES